MSSSDWAMHDREYGAMSAELSELRSTIDRLQAVLAEKSRRVEELYGCQIFEMHRREFARAERAEADAEALREALEPFAKCADAYDGDEDETVKYHRARRYVIDELTVGQFRKARAALAPSPAGREG